MCIDHVYQRAMSTRIHIVLDESDKARYRRQAEREGKSLGAWLRDAAEERLRAVSGSPGLRTRGDLQRFFAACDDHEVDPEPDWAQHRAVIEGSRVRGLDVT